MRGMNIMCGTLAIAATLGGCGGSAGGSADGGGTGTAGTGGAVGLGALTWKEGGNTHATLIASAARVKSATSDMLQVSGGEASGSGIAFGVVVMPPPLAPATYTFNGGVGYPIISMSYQTGGASSTAPTAASIVLTTLGETTGTRAVGTFTGTLSFPGGATKTVTDGKFDVALTVSTL